MLDCTNSLLPLEGRKIVVTRAEGQQGEAKKMFESKGAKVLDLPALLIGPPDEWTPLAIRFCMALRLFKVFTNPQFLWRIDELQKDIIQAQ